MARRRFTTSRDKWLSPLSSRAVGSSWGLTRCLAPSSSVAADRRSRLQFSTHFVCSREIFGRAHVSYTCSWRFSYSNHIFSVVAMYAGFEHAARGSLKWSRAYNTDTVSICCLPPRPTSHPFLKCKNLWSNTWRFLLSKTLTCIGVTCRQSLRLFFASRIVAHVVYHLLFAFFDNLKCLLH